ncbi:hypothetical protein [Hydrogenivirga sp. 128-5-R1-1]|uniref:hypothetical protein n=1 Tax=Hydrogenivirga sp. 128-5-R1-1 TaxID=392423 RepID=UPI00015EF6FF|nr:hypothetical protein [Hydrogenivirga sp. 128-5-R1-1]EDP74398.1 hypothetical protein HG1285_12867 [Hydrogenivirga sp. 128-5-R1-1]
MLKCFELEFDNKTGKVRLTKAVDLSSFIKANYEEKKVIGKGFSQGKTFRKIGSIPIDVLIAHNIDINDPEAIRDFLKKHPEYRTSEGSI